MSSPEQAPPSAERIETPRVSEEQYEQLAKGPETKGERLESAEKRAEKAKVEALESAISVEKGNAEKARKPGNSAPRRRGTISKTEKEASFKKHMAHVQSEMSAPQRTFSKVIHNKAIEKTSEFIGGTIARPNAILAGAVAALFLTLAVYAISKSLGYVLSGFESIGAFIVGWVIGILYDYIRVMVTGKK